MKKIILASTFLVAFGITSFAGEKDANPKLLNDLTKALRNSTQVNWTSKGAYNTATFNFNDKTAFAFYDQNDNELIGFGMLVDKTDLPGDVSDAINKKYNDWKVIDAMIFIGADGRFNYFAQVQKDNKSLALKITANGDVSIYAKMP